MVERAANVLRVALQFSKLTVDVIKHLTEKQHVCILQRMKKKAPYQLPLTGFHVSPSCLLIVVLASLFVWQPWSTTFWRFISWVDWKKAKPVLIFTKLNFRPSVSALNSCNMHEIHATENSHLGTREEERKTREFINNHLQFSRSYSSPFCCQSLCLLGLHKPLISRKL